MKKKYLLLIVLFIFAFAKAQTNIQTSYDSTPGPAFGDKIVTVTLQEPDELLIAEILTSDVTVNGGDDGYLIVEIEGGTPFGDMPAFPYTVRIQKNGVDYTGATMNATPNGSVYEVTFGSLDVGVGLSSYTVIVQDARGCSKALTGLQINEPQPLGINASDFFVSQPSCYDDLGQITLRAHGGLPNYNYQLFREVSLGPLNIVVVEEVGPSVTLDPSTNYTSQGLDAGNYFVRVTDLNGNGNAVTNSPTFNINDISPISFSIETETDINCFGNNDGAITLSAVTGGTVANGSSYTFLWTGDNGFTANTPNLTNLSPGNYTLLVTDDNECSDSLMTVVTIDQPNDPLMVTISSGGLEPPTSAGASDGAIDIDVSGGEEPYTYAWRKDGNTAVISTQQDITDLTEGSYEVTVTDANLCTEVFVFSLEEPEVLIVTIDPVTDILCNGDTGSLEATATGGIMLTNDPFYNFEWFHIIDGSPVSIGVTTPIASNLVSGTYRVIITDANDVTAQDDFFLGEPMALTITDIDNTHVSCHGGNNATASISVSGGSGEYEYLWEKIGDDSFSASTPEISNLTEGFYTIRVDDIAGGADCFVTSVVRVFEPAEPLSLNVDLETDILINGQNTGSIEVTTNGGTPGYTYAWSKEGDASFTASTEDIFNLTEGTYTLVVTDANYYTGAGNEGCTASQTFTLEEPNALSVVITENTAIACHGGFTGILDAIPSGGAPPFSYQWKKLIAGSFINITDPSATTSQLIDADTGTYRVEILDANEATAFDDFELTEPPSISISNIVNEDVDCFGDATGSITLDVTGGTGAYTYEWNNAVGNTIATTKDLINVEEGSYTLTIIDANLCSYTSNPITIGQPTAALSINESTITRLSGFETNNGSIDISVTGGTTPYSYLWTKDDDTSFSAAIEDITSLSEGTYTVIVTDAKECSIQESFVVTEPDLLEIVSISQSNLNACFDDATTDIEATVIGGVNPITYAWFSNADPSVILSTTNMLLDSAEGMYTLIVTDSSGNSAEDTNILVAAPTAITILETHTDILCKGDATGAIDITVSGGTTFETGDPYSIIWSNGATTEDLTNLSAGNYSVTVTDAKNCQTNLTIYVPEPTLSLEIVSSTITRVSGNGLSDGEVSVIVDGGTSPYTYQWVDSNGAIISIADTISNVTEGTYTLTVTDANECSINPVDFLVTEPLPLLLSIDETDITCSGSTGSLEAIATGGMPPYTYSWLNDEGQQIGDAVTIENVTTGFYTLIVVDQNENTETIIAYHFEEPDPLIINEFITDVSCHNANDGSILLNITGGSETYDISWDYDVNNNTTEATGLPGGTYTVIIQDQIDSSCSITQSFTVGEPLPYGLNNILITNPSSSNNDGSIALNVFGGTAPFNFVWIDQNGTAISNTTGPSTNIVGLPEGNYTLTVTDSSGSMCAITNTFTLGLSEELLIEVQQIAAISCSGENDAQISVTTNTGVNTFTWYDASVEPPVLIPELDTAIISVPAGTYYVEVYDEVQSITEISAPITITEPAPVVASISVTDALCFNDQNGSITINAEGGNGAYEYIYRLVGESYPATWIAFENGASATINDLMQGNYEVRVRDSSGCTFNNGTSIINIPAFIMHPDPLTIVNSTTTQVTGNGLNNGEVSVVIDGGTPEYTYQWVDNSGTIISTTDTIANLFEGSYTLTVIDANGCTIEPTVFEIIEPDPLTVTAEITADILCNGETTASISATALGGIPLSDEPNDYNFEWFDNSTMEIIGTGSTLEGIPAGFYFVIVTDANDNMTESDVVEITDPNPLIVVLTADFTLCGDGDDWIVTSTVTGGTLPYNFVWNNGANTPDLINISPGEYSLSISDQNGCITTASVNLVAPPALTASASITHLTCFNGSNGSIELIVNGGTMPYTYIWDNGGSSNIIGNLDAGEYQVSIIDSKGCELIQTYEIEQADELLLELGADTTLCIDQTLELDATIPDGSLYNWSSTNGFSSSDAQVTITEEGIYTVTAINSSGCMTSDEITVTTIQEPIDAEFLVSSQVFLNQPFVIVQVSEPFPDTVEWVLPDEATIIEMDTDYVELSFDTPGEYELTLIISNGNCTDVQTKQIIVIDGEDFDQLLEPSEDPIITSFLIYPNPNSGAFTLDVELREPLPLSVKIFRINSNVPIDQRYLEGQESYLESYNLNVSSGIYFMLLETADTTILKKLIIN